MRGDASRALAPVFALLLTSACGSVSDDSVSESAGPEATTTEAGEPSTPNSPAPADGDGSILFDSDESGNFEIYRLDPDGSTVAITQDPAFDSWWARPSPDRTEILFYRTPPTVHDVDFTKTSLWRANSDGSNAVELIEAGGHGWDQQGHAEWSPDGQRIVMFAGTQINPQIWMTDRDGANPEQITDSGGVNLDPSWAPDGSIVYVGCPDSVCFPDNQEIYAIDGPGGERQRLTDDDIRDHDPYVSPDGSTLAWLSQTASVGDGLIAGIWDIRVASRDGSDVQILTPGDAIYSLPRFSADGQSIFTHQFTAGSTDGFDLVEIDAESGAVTQALATGSNEEYPSP